MPRTSNRRENLLKALRVAFGDRKFKVADVTHRIVKLADAELSACLDRIIGAGIPNVARNIATGRCLQVRLIGKRFDNLELVVEPGPDSAANVYRVIDHNAPVPQPPLTHTRVDREGRIHTETLRDRNGEPLRDKSSDPPIKEEPEPPPPAPVPAASRVYRQPTRAELAARHNALQPPGRVLTSLPGNDLPVAEATTLWNRSLEGL